GSGYGTGCRREYTKWHGPCGTYMHVLRNGTIKNATDITNGTGCVACVGRLRNGTDIAAMMVRCVMLYGMARTCDTRMHILRNGTSKMTRILWQ
ncbi:13742_t:CDS:2, partial [Cetraspora pellucida]